MKRYVFIAFFLIFSTGLFSQDSLKVHSPVKAPVLSAFIPGAGQIYNKKYWKPPIVWVGLGAFVYLYINENKRYQEAKKSYLTLIDTIKSNDIPFNGTTNLTIVKQTKNVYRNQRDMYLIFGIVFYALNVVDAAVDAHFMNFNVNDNLTMRLDVASPNLFITQPTPTLNLTYNFSKKNEYSSHRIW